MKKLMLLSLLVFSYNNFLFAMDDSVARLLSMLADDSRQSVIEEKSSRLMQVAQNYLQFVHDVGSVQSVKSDDPRVNELFAACLTKIENRKTLFVNNRQLLLPQMKGFEKEDNPEATEPAWTIDIDQALIIPSAETNCIIAHFEWVHVHVGAATTMAILRCNHREQIECITEVWAKAQK